MSSSILTDKRLVNELKDLKKNKIDEVQAIQDETDKFTFYFLMRGDIDKTSPYCGGYYLGKILLPSTYPSKPGDFYMLTPNGRFTINTKICLTNSGYHTDEWTPTWSIRNMIIGFISIFNADDEHGISHIKESFSQRKHHAINSVNYNLINYSNIFVHIERRIEILYKTPHYRR